MLQPQQWQQILIEVCKIVDFDGKRLQFGQISCNAWKNLIENTSTAMDDFHRFQLTI